MTGRSALSDDQLGTICAQFLTGGECRSIAAFGNGHINDTYACTMAEGDRWVLQRINDAVFRQPRQVMENVARVTAHVRAEICRHGIDPHRRVLDYARTCTGDLVHHDERSGWWRMCELVENSRTLESAQQPSHAYAAAHAFGRFMTMLNDIPGPRLHETIPGFHDTPRRLEALRRSVALDAAGRVSTVCAEIDFALTRANEASSLTMLLAGGQIPERIVHNDTKLNNVLFDSTSGEALCVIDLDTVMPGLALYDFGDMVRVGANRATEDEPDTRAVGVDLTLFEYIAAGYLDAARDGLVPLEQENMVRACRVIAIEQGVRFLTDYLDGDIYYRTHSPDHNLVRSRAQFALVADMESRSAEMDALVVRHRLNA